MFKYLIFKAHKYLMKVPRYLRKSHTSYGGLKPKPLRDSHYLMGLTTTVIPGIVLGGVMAKNIAYFLEASELWISDDVDEDDE